MLYREIIAVCSEIHTKHINTAVWTNLELLHFKLAVRIASPGPQTLKQYYSNTKFFPSSRYSSTQRWHTLVAQYRLYCSSGGLQTSRITEGFFHGTTIDAGALCLRVWVHVGRQSAVSVSPPHLHPPIVDLQCYQTRMAEPTAEQLCCRTVKKDAFRSFNGQC